MTDYSVKMRCQEETEQHERCTRRGRRHRDNLNWLCWQHWWRHYGLPEARSGRAVFPEQVLEGS